MFVDVDGVNDLVLNEKGDWRFTETIQESLAQRVNIRLNTLLAEWGYNIEFGTPYKQRVWRGGMGQEELDALFTSIILQEEDVSSVNIIHSRLDQSSRSYSIDRVEVSCRDESIIIPIHSAEKRQNIYPDPKSFEEFKVCVFTEEEYEIINRIYYWTNFTLQEGAENSWWSEWKPNH